MRSCTFIMLPACRELLHAVTAMDLMLLQLIAAHYLATLSKAHSKLSGEGVSSHMLCLMTILPYEPIYPCIEAA